MWVRCECADSQAISGCVPAVALVRVAHAASSACAPATIWMNLASATHFLQQTSSVGSGGRPKKYAPAETSPAATVHCAWVRVCVVHAWSIQAWIHIVKHQNFT